MKLKLILTFLLCFIPNFTFSEEATIKISTDSLYSTPTNPRIFGGFVEFLLDYINGTNGMYGQELRDRGLDENIDYDNKSDQWKILSIGSGSKLQLLSGGYNKNGLSYQKLTNSNIDSKTGIYQSVYINDTINYDFYIYVKSNSKTYLNISYIDSLNQKTYYKTKINIDSSDWKKYNIILPKVSNMPNWVCIMVSIDTICSIDIDELSLMQSDNIFGVRKEYFDLIKIWKPGILRYPGGTFADESSSLFNYYVGDIDQRFSPNRSYPGYLNQRLDFGLHEYLMFCEKLNIEPQFTLNTRFEDEKVAWKWIEYATGDSNTEQGKIRSKLGHPKPFKLKYVELGNENWDNYDAYLPKYIKFYDYIKERNNNIMIIVNMNHWDLSTTAKVLNYIKDKVDLLSYHPTIWNPNVVSDADDNQIFLSTCGASEALQYTISYYHNWLEENGYGNRVKQAVSEWWSTYGNIKDWLLDSNSRNSSLESAMWNIGVVNGYLRNPDDVGLANRTNGIGFIKRGFNENGKRQIFGTASLWSISMLSNHHGDSVISTNTICNNYDAHESKELWGIWGAKRLDVSTTKSKDSIFISIVNRQPTDFVATKIIIDNKEYIGSARIYILNSDSFLDRNTSDEPFKVIPREYITQLNGTYTLPPHSYTIIAIPYPKSSIDSVPQNKNFTSDNVITNNLHFTMVENLIANTTLKIFNILGEEVFSAKLNYSQLDFVINLDFLPIGVYFGKINTINFKFLKKSE